MLLDLILALHVTQKIRGAHLHAAVAADVQLIARVDTDDAEILDGGLGAVARAARHCHLELVRRPGAPGEFFEIDAELRRVLGAEAAPGLADAGLHGADGLAVGMAGDEAGGRQIAPDAGEILLPHAEQIDALAAGDVYGRHAVLLRDLGDRFEFGGRGLAAPHARHDRVAAVLLDVGVHALVDEARLVVVAVLAGPLTEQVIVQRGAALRAAVPGLPVQIVHHRAQRCQALLADGPADVVVRMVGAGAQRFAARRLRIVTAQGVRQQRLDQTGAGAAGAGGLGVRAHLVEGEQFLFGDGADDVALAHAVAAADLGAVGHGGDAAAVAVTRVAEVRLAEQQAVAEAADVGAVAHELEVPGAVQGVAVHDRAADAVAGDHQLLVHAPAGVLEHHLLGAVIAAEVAGGEQVDAGDLQPGRGHRAVVARITEPCEVVGADLRLLEQGRDQAVGRAAVLDAFADGIDARVVGLQGVVDHDTASAVQAAGLGESGIRADADGHHHQVGEHFHDIPGTARSALAQAQAYALDPVDAEDGLGLRAHQEFQAARLERTLEQRRRRPVELFLHQRVQEMHDSDGHALPEQAVGRLQAEQAAADHDGVATRAGGRQHPVHVLDVAEPDHAGQIAARHGDDDGRGAGRQDQAVVARRAAVGRVHHPPRPVDLHRLAAFVQGDAVVRVPALVVEHDLLQRLLAGEHRREQDAVVVAAGLGAEYGDVVDIGRDLQELLQRAHARHAVADQNQFLFHGECSVGCPGIAIAGGSGRGGRPL